MTNVERQKQLDEQKWNESSFEKKDLSGAMDYCANCQYLIAETYKIDCAISQEERIRLSACARAYNKAKKELKGKR